MPRQIGLCGFVFTLLIALAAFAQNEIIEIEKPLKAQSLSGLVQLGPSPEGVPGVLVEECTKGWKAIKASIHTDGDGHFVLPPGTKSGVHYLRLSFRGAKTLLIKVKLDASAPKELALILSVAT